MKSLPQIAANAKQHRQPKPGQPDAPENLSDLAEGLAEPMLLKWGRTIRSGQPKLQTIAGRMADERASENWPKKKEVGEATKPNKPAWANPESPLTPNT